MASCFIFAGGGTGGHLYPGIAVAHAIRARVPDAQIVFLTTARPLDAELLQPTGFEQIPQVVRPFTTRPWQWPGFWSAYWASARAARELFGRRHPRAVLGLGGYAAGPAVAQAAKAGIPSAILNPDAVPGKANRFLARQVDLVALQWEVSKEHFPAAAHCQSLGCPIRPAFAERIPAAEARRRFNLDPHRPTLLVTGASQGARTVNQTLQHVWPIFHAAAPDWQLLHLSGAADEAVVRAAYQAASAPATVLAFTHEMAAALCAADIVISRAGASTLAELSAMGRPSILLPYPYHRDQHQRSNALVLVEAGAAILVDDTRDGLANTEPVLAALQRLTDESTRASMSAAALTLARPRAADAIAEWLISARRD